MGRDGVLPRGFFGQVSRRFGTPVPPILLVGSCPCVALLISLDAGGRGDQLRCPRGVHVRQPGGGQALSSSTRGLRGAGAVLRYGVLPGIGTLLCAWLWTSLSRTTFEVGLVWVAIGLVYLAVLTKGFRQPAPELGFETASAPDETAGRPVTGVAVCQLAPVIGDVAGNVARAADAVRTAVDHGAEVVVLPELVTTGYVFRDAAELAGLAEPVDGPSTSALVDAARPSSASCWWRGWPSGPEDTVFNSAVIAERGEVARGLPQGAPVGRGGRLLQHRRRAAAGRRHRRGPAGGLRLLRPGVPRVDPAGRAGRRRPALRADQLARLAAAARRAGGRGRTRPGDGAASTGCSWRSATGSGPSAASPGRAARPSIGPDGYPLAVADGRGGADPGGGVPAAAGQGQGDVGTQRA